MVKRTKGKKGSVGGGGTSDGGISTDSSVARAGGMMRKESVDLLSSESGGEDGKRLKLGSPGVAIGKGGKVVAGGELPSGSGSRRTTTAADVKSAGGVDGAGGSASAAVVDSGAGVASEGFTAGEMKEVTDALVGTVYEAGVSGSMARRLIQYAGQYEELLMRLMLENEAIKGKLSAYEAMAGRGALVGGRPLVSPAAENARTGTFVAPAAPVCAGCEAGGDVVGGGEGQGKGGDDFG
uniref:Uncharacterized protein n=1 Tax=Stomoxys calcitrans TaxID=35570 RepID=A0A1I8PRG5_STOCA